MGKASSLSDPRTLVGAVLSGGYRIERLLDEHGQGVLFAASDPGGHPVAIKVLRPEAATEEMLSRVSREASVLSKLVSAHLVPVLDVGHDLRCDLPYVVLPLLDGEDLGALLERVEILEPDTAARIAVGAAKALIAAHAAGLVFRDLRPSKIFLEKRANDEVVVRLLGPGLGEARTGWELTASGAKRRSAASSSPEGAPSQTRDAARAALRTDVLSLGAILYQMLSGKPPWGAASGVVAPAGDDARSPIFPAIQDIAPWVQAPLALALAPALTSDPVRVYPSAEAFEEMLRAVTNGGERLTTDMLTPLESSARSVVASRADADADPLVGHVLGGRYKVVRLIGRGGMGGVYEAEGPDHQAVAAKIIFRSVLGHDDQTTRRFIREARAATSIHSDHVVRTFDLGTDVKLGSPFIVMERLQGTDLARVLQEKVALAPGPAVQLFLQAAEGLGAAHRVGVVHRDVKPANLFLHAPDPEGPIVLKVCDFGVAKRTEDGAPHDLTRAGGVIGSPLYMSPEQVKTASQVDTRADVWGLCVALYQTLCGAPPWNPDASLAELLLSICTDKVPPLAQAAPWLPKGLAEVIHKGLAREPADRWQDMDALRAALAPFASPSGSVRMSDLAAVSAADLASAPPISSLRGDRMRHRMMADSERSHAMSHAVTQDRASLASRPPPSMRQRSKGRVWMAIAVVAATVAIVAIARGPAEPEPTVSSADAVVTSHVEVRVPEGADVRVNGEPVRVQNGAISLSGVPGDSFDVSVRVGDIEQRTKVFLSREGRPEPASIDPPARPVATLTTAAEVPTTAPTTGPSTTASASGTPTKEGPRSASTGTASRDTRPPSSSRVVAPPTVPTSSGVKPVESW